MVKKIFSFNQGLAITPIDGRNYLEIKDLSNFFSEYSYNKYRINLEINYLVFLSQQRIIDKLSKNEIKKMLVIVKNFGDKEYVELKEIETQTNHDIKAIEYFLQTKLRRAKLEKIISFIHFGLTSDDINNLAYGLMLKDCRDQIIVPEIFKLTSAIKEFALKEKRTPMLARTHGQPAVATTVGKEMANYFFRLKKQLRRMENFVFEGKCNGAVGNNNALKFVLPEKEWMKKNAGFVSLLGLSPNLYTTQILPYDNWIEFFGIVSLTNGILVDFCINVWQYIMLEVFLQKKKENEIGSSTMPQKVNPINFENAEGNLQLANSFFNFFERKLISSRLQRDLSDSPVRRSFGEAIAYSVFSWKNIAVGLSKIFVNRKYLQNQLDEHFEVLSEALQTYLRWKGDSQAYEKLKLLTRGKKINKKEYLLILKKLGLDKEKKLADLTPAKYTGYAKELVKSLSKKKR